MERIELANEIAEKIDAKVWSKGEEVRIYIGPGYAQIKVDADGDFVINVGPLKNKDRASIKSVVENMDNVFCELK